MTPDFGSIHRWPVRKFCIFSSYPFSLKDREQTQISSNTPFSINCQIIWRHRRTLENSGCGLTYGSSPRQAVKNKRLEWRLSCTVENVQCTHTPAANRHLQRPLLSVSLQKMNTLQRAKQSILQIFSAIIYILVHITTNVMMTTQSSNIIYPHY